jgi:hypothetical protein
MKTKIRPNSSFRKSFTNRILRFYCVQLSNLLQADERSLSLPAANPKRGCGTYWLCDANGRGKSQAGVCGRGKDWIRW